MKNVKFSKYLRKIKVADQSNFEDGIQTAVFTISDVELSKEDPISDPISKKDKMKLIISLPTILETPDELLTATIDHDGSVFG